MSEIAPSQPIVAQALPQTTPSTAPNSTTPSTEQTPATPRGVSAPNVAAEKTETLKRADEAITAFAQKAGLPAPKIETHLDRVKNAVEVYAKLVSSGKASEATQFLQAMGEIGEKFGLNFGLSTPPALGQGKGVALNADKFKGVDAQDPFYKVQQGLHAETKPAAAKPSATPTPEPTGNPATDSQPVGDPNTAAQSAEPTNAAQPNTPPDLRQLNVENVVRLAAGGKETITQTTLDNALKSEGLPPDAQKVLALLQAQLNSLPANSSLPSAAVLKGLQQERQRQLGPQDNTSSTQTPTA